jgi:hypothetical protein
LSTRPLKLPAQPAKKRNNPKINYFEAKIVGFIIIVSGNYQPGKRAYRPDSERSAGGGDRATGQD